jgi:hypothetical protein
LRRNPYRRKKRQKKSIFIYGTTFKKNESGREPWAYSQNLFSFQSY